MPSFTVTNIIFFATLFLSLCWGLAALHSTPDVQNMIDEDILQDSSLSYSSYSSSAADQTIPLDVLTLQQLYNATNGPNWVIGTGFAWDFSAPNANPCGPPSWYGIIECGYNSYTSEYFVTQLDLSASNLTGTIPYTIGNLTGLQLLNLSDNNLYSTIPAQISTLSGLTDLYLSLNSLTGTLPDEFGNLSSLVYFQADDNHLWGTLPVSFGNLHQLVKLDLSVNRLVGTIPKEYGTGMSELITLQLHHNLLTGTIPESFGGLSLLNELNAHHNGLSGTIPPALGNCTTLVYLYLQNNRFTGTLTASLGNLHYLDYFVLNDNFLTGTLPTELGNMNRVIDFDLNNNALGGRIPATLSNLTLMQNLLLHNNYFSGVILPGIGDPSSLSLLYIDLSHNQLTGTIPAVVFAIQSLQTFRVDSNCLSGNIPFAICGSTQLTSLLMDGVSASPQCQIPIAPLFSSAYLVSKHITGTIPACLFSMPSLRTLHLGGNSITGSIASDVVISPSLVDLALSHNRLQGEIPSAIQTHKWFNLDLSFNKLHGLLHTDFVGVASNGSLQLHVNRLSGDIPASLRDTPTIKLVSGNMFYCALTNRSSLPVNDDASANFQCGSNNFNIAIYLWLVVVGVIAVTVLGTVVYLKRNPLQLYTYSAAKWASHALLCVEKWMTSLSEESLESSVRMFSAQLSLLRRNLRWFSLCMLVVFIPVYGALSHYFDTYDNVYAWSVAAAFYAGLTPGVVLFVFWMLFVVLMTVLWATRKHARYTAETAAAEKKSKEEQEYATAGRPVWLVVALNVIVVVAVNVLYIVVTLYSQSQAAIGLMEFVTAGFKLIWNDLAIPSLFAYLHKRDLTSLSLQEHSLTFRVCIVIFNNILAPCAVIAAISPNCFYYVLSQPGHVTTSVDYQSCSEIENGVCTQYVTDTETSSYLPPFTYSYQCSSMFVQNYASIFTYMFLMDAFLKPLLFYCMLSVYKRCEENSQHGSILHRIVDACLPMLMKPPAERHISAVSRPVFSRDETVLSVINVMAILFTFGVVFPPLVVVIYVDVYMNTHIYQLLLGRLLTLDTYGGDSALLAKYREQLNIQCNGAMALLVRSIWPVLPLAGLFYSLFLFDTVGGNASWRTALWAPFVMLLTPGLLLGGITLVRRYAGAAAFNSSTSVFAAYHARTESVNKESLEMQQGNPLHLSDADFAVACTAVNASTVSVPVEGSKSVGTGRTSILAVTEYSAERDGVTAGMEEGRRRADSQL